MPISDHPLEALADLPGKSYAEMRAWMLTHAAAAELVVLEDAKERLTVETKQGLIGLRQGKNADVAIMVGGRDARWLHSMRTGMVFELTEQMPEVATHLRWSGGAVEGDFPPNFQFVKVLKAEQLGPTFVRLTFAAADLSSYGDDAIHFRLLVPPTGATPEWPRVAANGATVWPDGPGAPDRPVYTARYIDHDANTLVADVFLHEGGKVSTWAQELLAGDMARQTVGMAGPSGAGVSKAEHVLMASDETGFPAAARILENLPPSAHGVLFLEAEQGAACGYPISAPDGIKVKWLSRARGERLDAAVQNALEKHAGATLWYAGEKADAQQVRAAAKAAGWDRHHLRASGFWSLRRGLAAG